MFYGYMPVECDHIDGDTLNNNIGNLRSVSSTGNSRNQRKKDNNTSGFTGVYYHKTARKWTAQICIKGKCMNLGSFKEKSDAIEARKEANIKYGFHPNHGRN